MGGFSLIFAECDLPLSYLPGATAGANRPLKTNHSPGIVTICYSWCASDKSVLVPGPKALPTSQNKPGGDLRMYCIDRPRVPESNVLCIFHSLYD